MPPIKYTIQLEDQSSSALEDIRDRVLEVVDALVMLSDSATESLDIIDASVKSVQETTDGLKTSIYRAVAVFGHASESLLDVRERASELEAPIKAAAAATDEVRDSADGVKSSLDGWKGAIVVANAALELTKKGISAIRSTVGWLLNNTKNEIEINQRLNTIIQARSDSLEDARANYDLILSTVAEINEATAINTTQLRSGAAALGRYVEETETLNMLMGSMVDLTAGLTGSIEMSQNEMQRYAQLLGMALDGNTSQLERMAGIKFTDLQRELLQTGTEAERAALLAEMIGTKFGGAAKAIADNSPMGALARLNNAINDIQNTTGELATGFRAAFAHAMAPAVEHLGSVVERAKDWIRDNIDVVINTVVNLGTVVGVVAVAIAGYWMIANWPITLAIAAVAGLIAALEKLGVSAGDVLGGVMGVFNSAWEFIKFIGATIADFFIGVWESIVNGLRRAGDSIMNIFRNIGDFILGIISPVARILDRILGTDISGSIGNLRDALQSSIAETMERERIEFERFGSDWANVVEQFNQGMEAGRDFTNRLTEGLENFLDFGAGGFGGMPGMDGSGFDRYAVSTGGGMALRVLDPTNREMRGEMIRLLEDVAGHRYLAGAYQQAPVSAPHINLGGIEVHASPGMDEEALARRAGDYACTKVAGQFQEALRRDLRRG